MAKETTRKPPNMTLGKAVICIVALVVVLFLGFAVFALDTKVVFLLAIAVIGILLGIYGFSMKQMMDWFVEGCKGSIEIILILLSVGAVIGSWIISGVVPTIIYYGLTFLTPSAFMITGFLLCCIVSFCVGSSYSTLATLGVAFMGIGAGLGINPGLTGGMVLSGAMFGDKMSPFSDTTNLAPAVSGTTLFKHINSMLYTTVPAFAITAILYIILGARVDTSGAELALADEMMASITANFTINPILLIIPVLTIVLAVLKLPPVIAMLAGSFGAVILGFILQSGHSDPIAILNSLGVGYFNESGVPEIDRLLNRGGMISMMDVIAWTLQCLGMGEMLKQSGVINAFLSRLLAGVKKPRGLVLGTLGFSLVTACLTASQYLAIILPGMMMKDKYTEMKVSKRVLSRTLEDGGTMFSFLIPWDTAGIYTSSVLGIATLTYAPYAFLLILCPIIATIYACTGLFIFKDEGEDDETPVPATAAAE
ncbi:Na+/H+ antiporter NhaC [Ruminococcaceae bacterium OttesenSCG-928-D13]|nr:Na+/H+ antiporter NhaC [Ruminococcaceae bacterium OttesenSCG-928-D13]